MVSQKPAVKIGIGRERLDSVQVFRGTGSKDASSRQLQSTSLQTLALQGRACVHACHLELPTLPYTALGIPLAPLQLQPVGTSLLKGSTGGGALPAPFHPSQTLIPLVQTTKSSPFLFQD